jgi:hypothetical protein
LSSDCFFSGFFQKCIETEWSKIYKVLKTI